MNSTAHILSKAPFAVTETNYTNKNFSTQDFSAPAELWMRIMCISAGAICVVLGGIGNLTTLLSIATARSLWRFTNINIFLLALCDFISTTYVCGHFMQKYWQGCWTYSAEYCHLYSNISGMCYVSSLYLLALVSYDRYLMVRLGGGYGQYESRRTVVKRAAMMFIVVAAVVLPDMNLHWFTGFSVNDEDKRGSKCVVEVVQSAALYLFLNFFCILPVFIMLFCYVSVLRYYDNIIGKFDDAVTAAHGGMATSKADAHSKSKKRASRATRLVRCMFLVLLVTNSMYFAITILVSLFAAGYFLTLDTAWWTDLYLMTYTLAWLNNAINPILYAYVMPEFRKAARSCWSKVLTGVDQKNNKSDDDEEEAREATATANCTGADTELEILKLKSRRVLTVEVQVMIE